MNGTSGNKKSRLSVCALVPYPQATTPSQRFRIEQWIPDLEQRGISVEIVPFVDERMMSVLHKPGQFASKAAMMVGAFARRAARVADTARYDVVLVHRAVCIAGPALLEYVFKLLHRPVIFDFDDAIYMLHTTEANRRWGWLKFPHKTARICRLSNLIIAGNSYLADYARQHNPNVTVIPSSVDTHKFCPVENRSSNSKVIIGWTGSSTSQTYLESFAPVLRELMSSRKVELRIHSDRRPELDGVPVEWRAWSPENEAEEIAAFDIGIMPMPHEAWARGKCAMKALLYMSCGVPAVCEAFGTNREVIRDGENGILAGTPEQWLAALESLIDDVELRQRIGIAGRNSVEKHYSMDRCAELFADAVYCTVNGQSLYAVERTAEELQSRGLVK